ncbi:MAG: 4-(cytidine 5'-diphospho)-2-C-methyl-D-erythritol kinase [Alphaproteobacteria bacterium]|nr:MAG: 4-(cytidine 5'-diphospho)-2-C-methyl-D-erythritol kinase [Alphaproteobacteria bacterium]
MRLTGLAPAKVNLFLHVGPVAPDGYHPLCSLVAFADIGDLVTVEPSDHLSLEVTGPFGALLPQPGAAAQGDNLILKALRALGEKAGIGEPGLRVVLDKRLPVAAGLGGGSSDAGIALKLANTALGLGLDEAALEAVSSVVGADGPMCLRARTAWAEGYGERLSDVASFPPLHVVLVNPGIPSPTGAVYRAYDDAPHTADRPSDPLNQSISGVIGWLAGCRNDLEAPAVALAPGVEVALRAVAACPGVRLTRMSGSGATVFGVFDDERSARAAAAHLNTGYENWWIAPCVLGGGTSNSSN